jgi:hypothetical protein
MPEQNAPPFGSLQMPLRLTQELKAGQQVRRVLQRSERRGASC